MIRAPALPRFLLLYAALYAAFGVASPFLPTFLKSRGITPEEIALVLATGTAMRMAAGALAGRLADITHRWRLTLAICSGAAAVSALLYLPARHIGTLL